MRRARIMPLALLPALVAGCAGTATTEAFDQRMGSYVGRTEADLVSGLGVPSRTYEDPAGRRLLQYDNAGPAAGPSIAPSLGLGFGLGSFGPGIGIGIGIGTGFAIPLGGRAASDCAAVFEVQGGRVRSFMRRGEGCVAPPAA